MLIKRSFSDDWMYDRMMVQLLAAAGTAQENINNTQN